jgi:large subunit ribosomal protein L24
MGMRLRRNDQVVVLTGRAKGKQGKILRIDTGSGRAVVEGVNLVKRFVRKSRQNPQGGSVERECAIPVSNLALYDPSAKKATRFKILSHKDGSKSRVSVKSEHVWD